jgi:signal-transduction protein with cAMP-binding, CBS, and nucleotidyltransferase domain
MPQGNGMSIIERESVLSGLTVREAMRRLICCLSRDASIQQAVRHTVKYKINAVLIHDEKKEAIGVVSKTNIICAYYAGLPITAPLDAIMVAPPIFCRLSDSLDSALDLMRSARVQRLYVIGEQPRNVVGVLAYPDVLGILYKYCHKCERSTLRQMEYGPPDQLADHFKVCELMNPAFQVHGEHDSLMQVMESMSANRSRTVLIKGGDGLPRGVVTTTDLILAYMHGVPSKTEAASVMSTPAYSCDYDEPLLGAVRRMIFRDLDSLYVHKGTPSNVVGVVALADVARVRSGSCRACIVSRINLND